MVTEREIKEGRSPAVFCIVVLWRLTERYEKLLVRPEREMQFRFYGRVYEEILQPWRLSMNSDL